MGLAARDRAILDFERDWWSRPGPKEAAIRTELGVSATRYYEILRHLVDVPEAYEYDPMTVKRVRRERDRRRRERHEGRRADSGSWACRSSTTPATARAAPPARPPA